MKYKICNTCQENKEISNFHKNRQSYLNICKTCRSEKRNAEYAANENMRKLVQEKRREYYKNNPEKSKEINRKSYLSNLKKRLAYANNYYEENKAKVRQYQTENRESISKTSKLYNLANSERIKERNKLWRISNRDKLSKNQAKRVAKQKQAIPSWSHTEWEEFYLEEIYSLCKLRTQLLGVEYNVDHIVPLTSSLVCGLHCSANLRILEKLDNVSKGNRHWPDMW